MRLMAVGLLAAMIATPAFAAPLKADGLTRSASGKIVRSPRVRAEFKKTHPCPSTSRSSGGCPGYLIDHIIPLKRGGADRPANMQWQTIAAAKEKDKWE